jgi:serine/threonine protein kinase
MVAPVDPGWPAAIRDEQLGASQPGGNALSLPAVETRPPSHVGRYELLEVIGEGGMATVYRARLQGIATKLVALKLIHSNLSQHSDFVLMFLDEMRVAMALTHRNIVQTFDADKHGDHYYLVMELIEGATLRELLDAIAGQARLPIELCLFVAMELCAALEFAHTLKLPGATRPVGLVHRDVSPGNILLSAQGDVKLADFGVAKTMGGLVISHVASIKGKLRYMAPEQARGEAGRRSDIFSVGAVLYEMVSGQLFRSRHDPTSVARGDEAVTPPSRMRPDLPAAAEEVILACLRTDPLQRPASAEEVRVALAEQLFHLQYEQGSRDAHSRLRDFLEQHMPRLRRAASSEPDTAARVARALLESAELLPGVHGAPPRVAITPTASAAPHPAIEPVHTAELRPQHRTRRRGGPARSALSWPLLAAAATLLGAAVVILYVLATSPATKSTSTGDGGLRWVAMRAVDAGAGRAATLPASRNAAPPDATVARDAAPAPDATSTPGAAPRGLLELRSVPRARVLVDGIARGETPLRLSLPPGAHELRLLNPARKVKRTVRVHIRADQTLRRTIRLRR